MTQLYSLLHCWKKKTPDSHLLLSTQNLLFNFKETHLQMLPSNLSRKSNMECLPPSCQSAHSLPPDCLGVKIVKCGECKMVISDKVVVVWLFPVTPVCSVLHRWSPLACWEVEPGIDPPTLMDSWKAPAFLFSRWKTEDPSSDWHSSTFSCPLRFPPVKVRKTSSASYLSEI